MDIDKFLNETTKSEKFDYRGQELTLVELSYGDVAKFSELAKDIEDVSALESNKVAIGAVLRAGIKEMEDLTDDQLDKFSPLVLKELNEAVLGFNGLQAEAEETGK
jgi:hypothetical protein